MRIAVTVSIWLALARAAGACPSCPTARLARAAVCGPRFLPHLAATLAPLVVLVAIAWLLRRLDRPRSDATRGPT